jgi:hypothetical protein
MMHGVGIYATFYKDLYFARYIPSSFFMHAMEQKCHPKFAHAMKTSTTYHNYQIYHKNRNQASTVHGEVPACMHAPGVGWMWVY